MTYLNEHDKYDELGEAEAVYLDRLVYVATIRDLRTTLRAKDEQIAAMVELTKEAREYLIHEFPECECHDVEGTHYECVQCRLKEATL